MMPLHYSGNWSRFYLKGNT